MYNKNKQIAKVFNLKFSTGPEKYFNEISMTWRAESSKICGLASLLWF